MTCGLFATDGEAMCSCTVHIEDLSKVVNYDTQHPKGAEGLDKIAQLEAAKAGPKDKDLKPDKGGIPPKFTTPVRYSGFSHI